MEILFEDDEIIVCLKPAGIPSEGTGGKTVLSLLSEREKSPSVFSVHRLDRETQGIMVFAKSSRSASELSRQITEKAFVKKYYAVLKGCPEQKKGELCDLLYRDKQKNKTYVVKRMRKGVRVASLEYEIKEEFDGFSLADILLHTGRTHQIRVQFASRKMPLFGDGKYGGGSGGLCLFAYHLEFYHPVTGEKMIFDKEKEACENLKEIIRR